MKKYFFMTAVTGLTLVGCGNKVNFTGKQNEGNFAATPIIQPSQPENPPVISPNPQPLPAEPPPLLLKQGVCPVGANQKVLSCVDCESTAPVEPPPLLSRKAQELLDIMTAACAIHNKSDPAGYVAPSHAEILKRVIQCSPAAYPDTAFVNTQEYTIKKLLTDFGAQKKAFSGLYYNSASTDFETYFGLDIGEARYTFCRGQERLVADGVYPREYYDSLYYGNRPYVLPPAYVAAQKIRAGLKSCMAESLRNPHRPQPPSTPGVICTYETAEGVMSQLVVEKIQQWQEDGHDVFYEGFGQCGLIDSAAQLLDNVGEIKLAIKKCH